MPDNGLAIFAGYVDEEFRMVEIEPPKLLHVQAYRCANSFYLLPLQQMLANVEITGIISIDATECGIGTWDGNQVQVLEIVTSGVGGKSGKGGSSARRYERNRNSGLNTFYHRAANHINDLFLNSYNVSKIVVSGMGFTKDKFLEKEYLDYRLRQKITANLNVGYAGFEGLYQTVHYLK